MIAKTNPEEMSDSQVADLKAGQEKLMASAQKLFAKVYEQSQGAGAGAGAGTGAGTDGTYGANDYSGNTSGSSDDDVVDGDYREV